VERCARRLTASRPFNATKAQPTSPLTRVCTRAANCTFIQNGAKPVYNLGR
jgi:hypothetical protein